MLYIGYFEGKNALNLISAGAPPRTSLGELIALPRPPSCVWGEEEEERDKKGNREGARGEGRWMGWRAPRAPLRHPRHKILKPPLLCAVYCRYITVFSARVKVSLIDKHHSDSNQWAYNSLVVRKQHGKCLERITDTTIRFISTEYRGGEPIAYSVISSLRHWHLLNFILGHSRKTQFYFIQCTFDSVRFSDALLILLRRSEVTHLIRHLPTVKVCSVLFSYLFFLIGINCRPKLECGRVIISKNLY